MSRPLKAPLSFLILDMLGCLLMLLGLIEHFDWFHLVPEAWRFPYYIPVLLTLGLALIMPYQYKILLEALKLRGQKR